MRTSEAKRNFSLQLHERCSCFEKKAFSKHITKDEYDFEQKVWNSLSCKTFQGYMEIYLLANCLLLCNVFLRHSSLTLELLSDINQYLFIIKGIRGGMSMVSKRYALANNKYVEGV